MEEFIEKVDKTIEKFNMISDGECVSVALSGGKDSVALLYAMIALKHKYNLTVTAVHINHGIRGDEADSDESFVKSLCYFLGIKLYSFYFDVPKLAAEKGLSIEECGREVRYECFNRTGADKIATAHTLSDSVETILFNLARGASIKGLNGIPAVRRNVIRPLIECKTSEIVDFLEMHNYEYVFDSTNDDNAYSRNRIRNVIVPQMKLINSGFENNVKRMAESAIRDFDYIEKCSADVIKKSKVDFGYDVSVLKDADPALQYRAVSKIIKTETGVTAEAAHLDSIVSSFDEDTLFQINGGVFVRIRNKILDFPNIGEKEPAKILLNLGENPFFNNVLYFSIIDCKQFENLKKDEFSFFADYDKINTAVYARSRSNGDKYFDSKRKCTKKLKDCFNELKIDPEIRHTVPVFEANGIVIGFLGSNADISVSVDKNTKSVIYIRGINENDG